MDEIIEYTNFDVLKTEDIDKLSSCLFELNRILNNLSKEIGDMASLIN